MAFESEFPDEHVMFEDWYDDGTLDVYCSCGWESSGYTDHDATEAAWENHCDVVFMEATMPC